MKTAGGYYIIVIEDPNTEKVIACATLAIEQKFIHNCSVVSFYIYPNHSKKMIRYMYITNL